MSDATCVHDEVLNDPTPAAGEANEVVVWTADVFHLVSVIREIHPLGRFPALCAGDESDEAVALSGLLLGLGIDLTVPNSLAVFISKLKLESERSQRQEMADIEGALKAAMARLHTLNKQGHGDVFIPSCGSAKLYADKFVQGGAECLIVPDELPPNHRLKDLLPASKLVLGRYLAIGPWLVNTFGMRTPPGGITLDQIQSRTRELKNG